MKTLSYFFVSILLFSCGRDKPVEPEVKDPLSAIVADDFAGKWTSQETGESVEFIPQDTRYYVLYTHYSEWLKGEEQLKGSATFFSHGYFKALGSTNTHPEMLTRFTYYELKFKLEIDQNGHKSLKKVSVEPSVFLKQ